MLSGVKREIAQIHELFKQMTEQEPKKRSKNESLSPSRT